MIKEIRIKNYKSIQKMKMNLGRLTVLIGENGCGKTNVLEAISLASAAESNKLDNEFLSSRGIRVTEPQFMRSAFDHKKTSEEIYINLINNEENSFEYQLQNDNKPYSQWKHEGVPTNSFKPASANDIKMFNMLFKLLNKLDNDNQNTIDVKMSPKNIEKEFKECLNNSNFINKFLIYSPENFALRVFEKEGQIQPLGINGEGLLKLLKVLVIEKDMDRLKIIKEKLKAIDWFDDFEIPALLSERENIIRIKDKYLDDEFSYFDQRSSNEGFLFLLLYFALFVSDKTPGFFAIDNIDASLNPKLCWHLTKELVGLGKKFQKQAIVTTHNPAILDGLNLDDPEQKLFVVFRNKLGHTKVKQIEKPKMAEGQEPVRLSEAFLRGYIGGLPKGF